MGTRGPLPGEEVNNTKTATNRLVTAAEYFLGLRNFADTQNYALRARDTDPTHPAPPRLLSIASVLSAPPISPTRPDYYTVLNLARFESDVTRIMSSFKTLISILNPNTNKFPLSSEAYDVVIKAWAVLSDPVEKSRFDEELRRVFGGAKSASEGSTFWTMCPYCYYVYEYEKVYEDCCLRCSNGRCRRGFHSAAIPVPPPPELIEEGHYRCPGFVPFDFGDSCGGQNGGDLWVPFAAPPTGFKSKESAFDEDDCNGDRNKIDISDEETEVQDHSNGKKTKTGGEDSINGGFKDAGGENFGSSCVDESGFIGNVVNEGGVNWNAYVNGNECLESAIGGETCESEIEFYEGKDDVLVGFQCDFDLAD